MYGAWSAVIESVQSLVDELIQDDSVIALLGDNEAAIRAFDAVSASWRNRHLRMRAVAGRERIEAGLLKVSHLPGEYQIADLGTKPLARVRILRLLELVNIRGKRDPEGLARDARMLSRVSFGDGYADGELAKTLAGLALLAMLPRVKGQPFGDHPGSAEIWRCGCLGHWLPLQCCFWVCVVTRK